jgi:hypothetical protein
MRRAASRLALAGCALFCAADVYAQATFGLASLRGTYSYVNIAENIASFGLITFDGNGKLSAKLRINRPVPTGGRTVVAVSQSGTYTVDPDGHGVATIQFPGVPEPTVYDFLITRTAAPPANTRKGRPHQSLATEVFSVNRSGGLNGQVVAPTWTRRADQ